MAITSEIIGKLGGADVEVTPVEGSNGGDRYSELVLHTVNIPTGETWLVAVIGDVTPSSTSSNATPDLMLGDIKTNRYNTQRRMTVAGVHAEVVEVKLRHNSLSGVDSFTGHVYTVKM